MPPIKHKPVFNTDLTKLRPVLVGFPKGELIVLFAGSGGKSRLADYKTLIDPGTG